MTKLKLTGMAFIALAVILTGSLVPAADKTDPADSTSDEAGRFYDLKIPEGFKSEAVDEAGIMKWRKDNGEIYLAVGESFGESADKSFDALKTAAEKDKRLQEVKPLGMTGAKALLYKEKPPEDPDRLRFWRLVVITDKKTVSVDFSAPGKEFESFVPAFESAINSFKLKSSS